MSKDIISVIVPCYNAVDYLEKCFESIKDQTYGIENLEVIFIDDASTDSTYSMLDNFYNEYPDNVIILRNETNLFCGGARNVGLNVARGKYVSFVDADDWLDVTALEKMHAKAEEKKAEMVQCLHKHTDSFDVVGERKSEDRFLDLENDDCRRDYFFSYGSNDCHGRLYLRSYLEDNNIRFVDHMFCENVYFTMIGTILLKSIYFLNEELYYYYEHENSVIHCDYNWERNKTYAEVPNELDKYFSAHGLTDKVKRFWQEYQMMLFYEVYFGNYLRFGIFKDSVDAYFTEKFAQNMPNMQNNYYLKTFFNIDGKPFEQQCVRTYIDNLRKEANDLPAADSIHVCFGLHDRTGSYSAYIGAVMQSILKNTKETICFHILMDDSVSEDNKKKLNQTAKNSGAYICFHYLDKNQFAVSQDAIHTYSIGTLFRLCIPKLLNDISKVIYLDADIMFNRDIRELWNVDVDGYAIAGVHDAGFEHGVRLAYPIYKGDVRKEDYVNAGVLVMNLDYMRAQGDLFEMSMDYLHNNPDADLLDQDALNYLFRNHILILDRSFNAQTKYERMVTRELNAYIYHYMGEPTIHYNNTTEFDKEYLRIRESTPWGYYAIENELINGLGRSSDRINHSQQLIKALARCPKKIYCGYSTYSMDTIVELIPMGENDYFVDGSCAGTMRKGKSVNAFSAIEREERGRFILLVQPEAEGGRILGQLEAMGLVLGEDYFVIPRLLTSDQGGYWL